MPQAEIDSADLTDGSIELSLLLVKAGLTASKSEARRAIEQGGVSLDGEKITDFKATVSEDALRAGVVVRRGKKAFKKAVLKA